ncbi:hypothetical protein ACQZ46_02390 [Agrobacterium salinitolerans]
MPRSEFTRKTKQEALQRSGLRCCTVNDCQKDAKVKGLCWSHYMRNRRHGTPLGGTTDRGAAIDFFNSIPSEGTGCTIWPYYRDSNGSARLVVKDGASDYVARRICERTYGPRGPEYDAAHSCGNGDLGCVSPWHLSWKTRAENFEDRKRHGTWGTKLSESQVVAIKRLSSSVSKKDMADLCGVTKEAIAWILSGKGWTHVE